MIFANFATLTNKSPLQTTKQKIHNILVKYKKFDPDIIHVIEHKSVWV